MKIIDVRDEVCETMESTSNASWHTFVHLGSCRLFLEVLHRLTLQEFPYGHIRGATNIVVDTFRDDGEVDKLIDGPLGSKEVVVVHCQLSQQRGPFAAARSVRDPS